MCAFKLIVCWYDSVKRWPVINFKNFVMGNFQFHFDTELASKRCALKCVFLPRLKILPGVCCIPSDFQQTKTFFFVFFEEEKMWSNHMQPYDDNLWCRILKNLRSFLSFWLVRETRKERKKKRGANMKFGSLLHIFCIFSNAYAHTNTSPNDMFMWYVFRTVVHNLQYFVCSSRFERCDCNVIKCFTSVCKMRERDLNSHRKCISCSPDQRARTKCRKGNYILGLTRLFFLASQITVKSYFTHFYGRRFAAIIMKNQKNMRR